MEQLEVLELVREAKKGNEEAKTRLLIQNAPLVKSVIRRFCGKGVEYEDLYQLGCVGFLKAINNFDSKFDVKFTTYAVPMIAGEVKRFLRDDGEIKVSRATKSLCIEMNRFISAFQKENGNSPGINQIAQKFNIEENEVVFTLDSFKSIVSIYESSDDSERSRTILDKLPDTENESSIINKITLKNIIGGLPPKERTIIILRYFKDMTQGEIASILNISQVQVSRIENRVLEFIKSKFA